MNHIFHGLFHSCVLEVLIPASLLLDYRAHSKYDVTLEHQFHGQENTVPRACIVLSKLVEYGVISNMMYLLDFLFIDQKYRSMRLYQFSSEISLWDKYSHFLT